MAPRVGAAAAIGLVLFAYGYRLGDPPDRYYDEVYHARRATELATEGRLRENVSTHPPLWHYLSALSMRVLGVSPWALRLPSLVGGIAVLALTFFLARLLTGSAGVGALSAAFLALDGVSITQSRIGMLNTVTLAFCLAALLCVLQQTTLGRWPRRKAFLWAGLLLGLGLATKLVALLFGPLIAVVLILQRRLDPSPPGPGARASALGPLIALPVLVFLAVHLVIPLLPGGSWSATWRHITHGYDGFVVAQGHSYGSRWWSWPFMARPIWYFYEQQDDLARGVLCIGNPAVFWTIPLSVSLAALRLRQARGWRDVVVLAGFLSMWLPWILVRRVQFFHFVYPALPFACIGLAVLLDDLWRSSRFARLVVLAFAAGALLMAVYWFPLWTAIPISHDWLRHHLWFRGWV